MKKMNRKTIGLVAAALMLVATIGVGSALAYFTTYTRAEGSKELTLNFSETEINEKIIDKQKVISLSNTGEADIYVRVKALVGEDHPIVYSEPENAGKWVPGADGFYYYTDILAPGEATSEILVGFTLADENAASFNVIIVQESTVVLYDEDGNAQEYNEVDWDIKADVSQTVIQGDQAE